MTYDEVDRGHSTVCWIVPTRKMMTARIRRQLGRPPEGMLWRHLCERWGEPNHCCRPDHLVLGDKSSNAKHMHDLRRAAGVPWSGARLVGTTMPPEVGRKISTALTGKKKSPEHVENIRRALTGKKRGPQPPEVVAARAAKLRGQKRTAEQRAAMSARSKERQASRCPMCGEPVNNFNRARHLQAHST